MAEGQLSERKISVAEDQHVEDHDVCGVCKSAYTTPRLLDCCHVFCSPCIEKLIENGQILRCPLCRRELPIPKEGVDGLSLYPFIELFNSKNKNVKPRVCDMCDEMDVHSRCVDCDQNMCKHCHDNHLRNKTLRKHKVEDEFNNRVTKEHHELILEDGKCDVHSKGHSLYCKSCNLPICEHCKTSDHACHKTEKLDIAIKAMKSTLSTTLGSLNSKIPFLDNVIHNAKAEENKYGKDIQQTKGELESVASNLKELMCKSVDMVMAENLEILELFSCADNNTFETYIKEAKQNRLAIIRLIKSIEATIKFGQTAEVVRLCSVLCTKTRMYNENYSSSELKLNIPMFKPGTLSYHHMQDYFGVIKRDDYTKILLKPQFPYLQIQSFPNFRHFTKESSFQTTSGITSTSIMATGDSHVCITCFAPSNGTITVFNMNGQAKQTISHKVQNRLAIIGVNVGKCFMWKDNKIDIIQFQREESFETQIDPWENTLPAISQHDCAWIMNNGNMVVLGYYNTFYELEGTGRTLRTFTSNAISQRNATSQAKCILYTKTNIILVAYDDEIFAITLSGDRLHSYKQHGSKFTSMCTDRHGNIFVTDSGKNCVCLLNSDGYLIRNVLCSEDGITNPVSITIDGRGNLWILMNANTITVFSYL
ncbi:TRIM56 [Mytilus edulis]|uniref:TRIM56 n=1 Tax=Mytilus edulis TaxID=6550 RepID=A0A8S3V1X1_MYTED|nr:TRIM56 [Mytilus edulis]